MCMCIMYSKSLRTTACYFSHVVGAAHQSARPWALRRACLPYYPPIHAKILPLYSVLSVLLVVTTWSMTCRDGRGVCLALSAIQALLSTEQIIPSLYLVALGYTCFLEDICRRDVRLDQNFQARIIAAVRRQALFILCFSGSAPP